MKNNLSAFVAGFFMLVSFSAQALNQNSSWSEIMNQRDLYADFPVVLFLSGTVQVSSNDVCLDGDHVRKINPRYEKCFDQNDELVIHGTCARKEVYTLSAPRVQIKHVCMEYNYQDGVCAKTKTVRSVIAMEQEVSVYRRNHEDLRAELLFKKSHKINECR